MCSVVPGQLESFRNYKGFGIIFPKILDEVKIGIFPHSSLRLTFESESFRFPFPTKNSLTWGLTCEIKPLENRREFIRYATKIVHKWNGHQQIFSLFKL